MSNRALGLAAVLVTSLLVLPAEVSADNRSWTVAKTVVTDKAAVIGSVNITAVQQTGIYKTMVPMLIAQQRDAQQGLDMVKASCGFDPQTSITDVSFALDENQKGVVFLGLAGGLGEAKALDCLQKIADAKAPTKGKIVAKKRGRVTEYSMPGEKKKLYAAWLAKDVIAFSTDPDDRVLLDKVLKGRGIKGPVGGLIGRANMNAAAWFVATKGLDMPGDVKGTPKGAVVTVDVAATTYTLDAHLVMATPAEAKAVADQAAADFARAKSALPPDIGKVLAGLKIASSGDAATMKLAIAEKDIMTLLGGLLGLAGSGSAPPPPPPPTRSAPPPARSAPPPATKSPAPVPKPTK